ncbi:MAG: hypothetical protein GEU28_10825 [Dehalococcoidia bacterium]|nr:hypothetical protein [Dehalococcoidia bacterium]
MTTTELGILNLEEMVDALGHDEHMLCDRILSISSVHGRIDPPEEMKPWIRNQFGSVEATLEQKIIKVTNQVTLEGTLYNWLRSNRPMWRGSDINIAQELLDMGYDPLGDPFTGTPADEFGRVEGEYCVTASNIAKFDGFHGLIVFNERHPLKFTREQVQDYFATGDRWAARAHETDQSAIYYLMIWNCLWRAGASLLHGHAQVMLGRDLHYPSIERLRRDALIYGAQFRSNYFDDLYTVHQSLNCAFERKGVRFIASLTPVKENEIILTTDQPRDVLADAIFDVLTVYRDKLGVTSFNLAMYGPPLARTSENWEGFPTVVRIVDRGDPKSRTADFAAMEIYAASVVAHDPLRLAALLRQEVAGSG